MTVIIKCPPVKPDNAGICLVAARPYGGVDPRPGETAYLWFSESAGGIGLAHRGRIEAIGDGSPLVIAIRLDGARLVRPLERGELAEHRDSTRADPLSSLARKLYRHALDKVAALDEHEAALLDQHFD